MANAPVPFDRQDFLDGIHLAMQIGEPTRTEDKATFYFPNDITVVDSSDAEGIPFDPTKAPTYVPRKDPIQVRCAVEYRDAEGKIENFGVLVPSKAIITLLDPEYQQIKGFQFVALGGVRYYYRSIETPLAMFDVDVWVVHCVAEDQV